MSLSGHFSHKHALLLQQSKDPELVALKHPPKEAEAPPVKQPVSKHVNTDKLGREIRTHEDFKSAVIREADGSTREVRGGKVVPGSEKEGAAQTSRRPKKDVAGGESKFYKPTQVSTIVQKTKGDEDTAGDAERGLHLKKKTTVPARAYKL